jgi:hypothetical protein
MRILARNRRTASYQRVLLHALIILLLAASQSAARPITPTGDEGAGVVPFDSANDLIIVEVSLEGRGPFRFLLDSGASDHVMTPELAKTLGLKVEGAGVIDAGNKTTVGAGLVRVARIEVGGLQLHDQRFFVTAFPPEYPFQGFLGAELFKRFAVRVDFLTARLTLTRAESFRYQGAGFSLPLKLYKGSIPEMRAEVDGLKGQFKLDTGYNGSLALFGQFIEEHKLLKKYATGARRDGGQTLAGASGVALYTRVRTLELGELEMRDVATALFTERGTSNDAFAGAIGTGIFKQFNVVFDYDKQRVIFERR